MKIKTATFSKELKIGLPKFSNATLGMSITVEVGDGEELNPDAIWDKINHELMIESHNGLDEGWLRADELKNEYKLTIKFKKRK